ncbi:MAG: L-histidine N(alpha)-methyltransferase [Gemmatimonadota bacterium]
MSSGVGAAARTVAEERITLRRAAGEPAPLADLERDARRGLTDTPKWLPPKYFYDARGSRLFERITELPEYYQTRAERAILHRVGASLVDELRPEVLVEFGSGSASKTRVLLDAMEACGLLSGYGAIEVSESALRASAEALVRDYPSLRFVGVLADFQRPVPLPFPDRPRLILLLGSTIGNLTREEAVVFLRRVRDRMTERDGFLIGFDLVKDVGRLEAADNDSEGVTAEFNRNVLRVLNRELGADFDPYAFRHLAFYDVERSRIEMQLVSGRAQRVRLDDLELVVSFGAGESVRTELSHKYTRESALALLRTAGFAARRWETDDEHLFAVGLFRRAGRYGPGGGE